MVDLSHQPELRHATIRAIEKCTAHHECRQRRRLWRTASRNKPQQRFCRGKGPALSASWNRNRRGLRGWNKSTSSALATSLERLGGEQDPWHILFLGAEAFSLISTSTISRLPLPRSLWKGRKEGQAKKLGVPRFLKSKGQGKQGPGVTGWRVTVTLF